MNERVTTHSNHQSHIFSAVEFLRSGPKKLLIGGKWVPAKSGKTFETINPANEEVLALVAEGDKADVEQIKSVFVTL